MVIYCIYNNQVSLYFYSMYVYESPTVNINILLVANSFVYKYRWNVASREM